MRYQICMDMPSEPHLVPGRACGTCMMCCKVPYIKAFEKPAGVWCAHAVAHKGCVIYASRPDECRAFYCLWMQDASFGPEWKPEKAKFVTYIQQNGVNIQIGVDPSYPNAWMREPYYGRIKQWAREGAADGRFVFVRIGQRMIAVLPDRDHDIGRVDPRDNIVVARKPGPAGVTYEVEVQRAGS